MYCPEVNVDNGPKKDLLSIANLNILPAGGRMLRTTL